LGFGRWPDCLDHLRAAGHAGCTTCPGGAGAAGPVARLAGEEHRRELDLAAAAAVVDLMRTRIDDCARIVRQNRQKKPAAAVALHDAGKGKG
jgi:hypothetical protein